MNIRPSQRTRFWRYVNKTDDCWLWTGAIAKGYGQFVVDWDGSRSTTTRRAHRVAYEIEIGPIPDGMTLDHLCGVKNCVNPAHLEPVTAGENARRGNTRDVCKAGLHRLEGHNVITRPSAPGWKECRACTNERRRKKYVKEHAK